MIKDCPKRKCLFIQQRNREKEGLKEGPMTITAKEGKGEITETIGAAMTEEATRAEVGTKAEDVIAMVATDAEVTETKDVTNAEEAEAAPPAVEVTRTKEAEDKEAAQAEAEE